MFNLTLCAVVLHITTTKVQANHSHYSLTIRFAALSAFISVESLSGGTLIPAVGFI